jgi:hypothetical protein
MRAGADQKGLVIMTRDIPIIDLCGQGVRAVLVKAAI